jgi:hypothetical protein
MARELGEEARELAYIEELFRERGGIAMSI